MLQTNSTIHFTRSTERKGIFSTPAHIFQLTRSDTGADIGTLTIRHNKAEYSSADRQNDFRIRRSYWNYRWKYDDDNDRLFARIKFGFRASIIFADESRYQLKIKRRWKLKKKAADEYAHLATFYRNDEEVAVLQNNQSGSLFDPELHMPMSGTITTSLQDETMIAGLLILFQTTLMLQTAAAATG